MQKNLEMVRRIFKKSVINLKGENHVRNYYFDYSSSFCNVFNC